MSYLIISDNKNETMNILGFKSIWISIVMDYGLACKYQHIIGCRITFSGTWHNNYQSDKAKTKT